MNTKWFVGAISESRAIVGNWNAFVMSGIGEDLYGNSIAVTIRSLDSSHGKHTGRSDLRIATNCTILYNLETVTLVGRSVAH